MSSYQSVLMSSGMDKYVVLTCTDECKMHFHHDCWKLVEKLHRGIHPDWRLKVKVRP